MSELHRTNAGYLGVSMEETQDPFWSYNKLALGLLEEPGLSVAESNGALPVHNTTDRDGAVKGSGTRTDPFASSLVLAIAMDGTNGGTSFTDLSATIKGSGSPKSITRVSNPVTSTTSSKYYGSSGSFNGSSYLSLADSPDWAFGTNDFTVETWAYVNSGSALFFGQGDGGSPSWIVYGNLHIGPGIWSYNFGPSTPTGRWFHWAMVRQGTTVYFYIDGAQYGPYTGPSSWSDGSDALTIGQARGQYTNGYFQDFRIYNGAAKYTSSFTPPQMTTLVLDRSPSRKAANNTGATWQTSVSKFYGGATQFGSSRVLTLGSSEDFNFGTGDFTIEYWLYRTSLGSNDAAITNYSQVGAYFMCLHSNTTDAYLFLNGSSVASGGVAQANAWIHYAFVRDGTTCTIYKNGSPIASATSSAQAGSTNVMNIGAYSDGTSAITGHIQDVRFYKGIAKYTSSFTPPARSLVQTARRYPSGMHVLS